jgi:hypothetical protein
MNPLELRKVIVVGASAAGSVALVDRDGLPADPLKSPMVLRVAFWVPARPPHRRCAGATEVIDAKPFELQALKDGAIVEQVHELEFPEQPTVDEMRRRLMPVWEGLTVDSLGVLPNGAPEDHATKPFIQFTAVTQ